MRTFFPAMWPAFFILVSPASRKAKPACMNITSTAVTTTQIVLAAISRSWFLGTDLHLLQGLARPVVRDVLDGRRPDEAVARLVAAPGGVGDRRDRGVRLLVVHDEDEERLRQEAGLEDAAPVLVRHAALATVPDRLDDGDADVSRGLLDRVDHGLDTLANDDCFDLDHARSPRRRSRGRTRRGVGGGGRRPPRARASSRSRCGSARR